MQRGIKIVPSLLPLSCESLVRVKENLNKKNEISVTIFEAGSVIIITSDSDIIVVSQVFVMLDSLQ